MAQFTGTLNTNEFYNGLYNAYALIYTYANNLSGLDSSLVNKFKVDGGMYKDKSVFTDVDILTSRVWDPSDTNVLATEQKAKVKQQEITLSLKRQIGMTTEQYLSKRAWMDENSFSQFNSVVQAQIGNTKKIYEQRMVDTAIGNMETSVGSQAQTITIPALASGSTNVEAAAWEKNKVKKIGKKMADLYVNLKDSTRDYNDNGFMKSYDPKDILIIWNIDYLNEFNYVDLPEIFHADGIIDFAGDKLPGRYFGRAITSSDKGSGKIIDGNNLYDATKGELRTLVEKEFTFSGEKVHLFPGDKLTTGMQIDGSGHPDFTASELYIVDSKIICKVVHKDSIKYLSSFVTSTEFFNAKNLSQNRYLTWMYAYPTHLEGYPLITLREVSA